jgi:hypothetical protein
MENRVQILRHRRPAASRRRHSETVYAVTDVCWQQIRADQVAGAIASTGTWKCDVKSHWLSEMTEIGGSNMN